MVRSSGQNVRNEKEEKEIGILIHYLINGLSNRRLTRGGDLNGKGHFQEKLAVADVPLRLHRTLRGVVGNLQQGPEGVDPGGIRDVGFPVVVYGGFG